jgi:Raf kinase inhibitor-like YbhB/YbcL family protein
MGATGEWQEVTIMALQLSSPAFGNGERIPGKYARQGGNVVPPLSWSGVPSGTQELALLVDDPDAPGSEPFVHWIAYGIPTNLSSIPEGQPPALRQGKNSFGNAGYDGPAPPPGSPHHYHFRLYALDRALEPGERLDRKALLAATKGHTLAQADLVGTYQSQG